MLSLKHYGSTTRGIWYLLVKATFNNVVKATMIRLVLSLAVLQGWILRKLDVHNVFLHMVFLRKKFTYDDLLGMKVKIHHIIYLNWIKLSMDLNKHHTHDIQR
jgi:hypothetical protein